MHTKGQPFGIGSIMGPILSSIDQVAGKQSMWRPVMDKLNFLLTSQAINRTVCECKNRDIHYVNISLLHWNLWKN